MKKFFLFIMLYTITTAYGQVYDTIIKYTFPDSSALSGPFPDAGITANLSNKMSTQGGTNAILYNHAGATTWSARATGWNAGNGTKYWMIKATTLNYNNLKISSKQRSSATGPRDFKAQYKAGYAGIWTDITGTNLVLANNYGGAVIANAALPAACNNMDTVYIRWIMTSDSAITAGTLVVQNGPSNIDDIWLVGQLISTGMNKSGDQHNFVIKYGQGSVSFSFTDQPEEIRLFDICGNLVRKEELSFNPVLLETGVLSKGLYFVRAFYKDGSTCTEKIVLTE